MISIKNVILLNKPLSNFELEDGVKKLKIPFLRGVFLLDTLHECVTGSELPNGAFTVVSDIDFDGFSLKNVPDPIDGKDAFNRDYPDGKKIQPAAPIKPIIKKPNKKEYGIVNFDKSGGPGTHWVTWYKNGKTKIYFDSYGVQPPIEIINYLGKPIHYNTD